VALAALGRLGLVPEHVHLFEVGVGGGAAVFAQPILDVAETAPELPVRTLERALGIDSEQMATLTTVNSRSPISSWTAAGSAGWRAAASRSSATSSSSLATAPPGSFQSKPTREALVVIW
jgi:hypothetical protein